MKRQATTWEKYLHDDEGFISRIYKESSKLNTEKTKHLKWGKHLNWHFTKEDIQMENTYMKRCSTLLVMTEIHIQATMRQHTIIMALNSFFLTVISVGKDWKQQECSHTAGGSATWHSHSGGLNKCFFLHLPKFTFTPNFRVWPYLSRVFVDKIS